MTEQRSANEGEENERVRMKKMDWRRGQGRNKAGLDMTTVRNTQKKKKLKEEEREHCQEDFNASRTYLWMQGGDVRQEQGLKEDRIGWRNANKDEENEREKVRKME